jgi:hypothetical protein
MGEQLLWLSIDDFERGSVSGSLDPTQPNFVLAWREFHGRVSSPLMAVLANDDWDRLQSGLFATGEPGFNHSLLVVSAGSDLFETSTAESRWESVLSVAAQFGAVRCAQCLLMNGVKVGTPEVEAAFRSGNVEMMRLLCNAFPSANPLELALAAVMSWNVTGLRWLLDHKIGTLALSDLVRLLTGAISSGSYSCASSVLGSSETAASHLRDLCAAGVVGPALCRRLESLRLRRGASLFAGDSMAAEYSEELSEWLPEATEARLVARHEGRDVASVNAFVDAAKGRAKTLTFVETENGGSICGGYLDVAWAEGDMSDPGMKGFIFTLKNHLGVIPMKFAQKRSEYAAYTRRDDIIDFGCREGFQVWPCDDSLNSGVTYEAPRQGVALFKGDRGWPFRSEASMRPTWGATASSASATMRG